MGEMEGGWEVVRDHPSIGGIKIEEKDCESRIVNREGTTKIGGQVSRCQLMSQRTRRGDDWLSNRQEGAASAADAAAACTTLMVLPGRFLVVRYNKYIICT